MHWTNDSTYNAQNQRIIEGLRKARVPEGTAKLSRFFRPCSTASARKGCGRSETTWKEACGSECDASSQQEYPTTVRSGSRRCISLVELRFLLRPAFFHGS
jgi:hypothetical protein